MVTQELRIRYQRSVLGFLWTLINPILMMATMTAVFSQLQPGLATGSFTRSTFLPRRMVPWTLFAGTLTRMLAMHRR